MTEKDPIEELYDKIEELLLMIQSKEGEKLLPTPKIPQIEVDKKLRHMKENLEKFEGVSQTLVKLSGVSQVEIEERLAGKHDALSDDSRYLLKKGEGLLKQVKELQRQLQPLSEAMVIEEEKKQVPLQNEKPGKRKSKFNRFGGNKNWKPL